MSKPDVKNSIWKELWEYIKMIIFVVVVVLIVNNFLLINARVPSESMEKTIMTGDRFFGNRLAYLFDDPERFDIVVFKYPDDESQLFVKRVIGLPGETVEIKDGKVYINGSETPLDTALHRRHLREIMALMLCRRAAILCWEITVIIPETPVSGNSLM